MLYKFKEFLVEKLYKVSNKREDFGCMMLYFDFDVKLLHSKIDKDDIYNDENNDYDVLKFDVKCVDNMRTLYTVNKELTDNLPYTNEYPKYHPHCTVAYLKAGLGKKYVKIMKDDKYEVIPKKLVYSKSDNSKSYRKVK